MKNLQVQRLIKELKESKKDLKNRYKEDSERNYQELKNRMKKIYRKPWKTNGIFHQNFSTATLPITDLDNWEILRINLADRSYQYPRKTITVCSVGKEFNKINYRNQNGSIPYNFQSDLSKVNRLKQKIGQKVFYRFNANKNSLFGFPKLPKQSELMKNKRATSQKLLKKIL